MSPAPQCVGSSPAEGAEIEPKGVEYSVVFSFDQNIKCPKSNQSGISVSNGAAIEGIIAYEKTLTIKLSGLASEQNYTVSVPKGAVQGFKVNQKETEGLVLSFSVKKIIVPEPPKPETHYELDPVKELSNQNASQQAKNVYKFLLDNSGKKMLTGVQSEGTANNNEHVNLVFQKTGKHPALAGYDFIFLQYSPTPAGWSWVVNYEDMSAPIEHWKNNGLVNYMWHWNVPGSEQAWRNGLEKGDFNGYNFYTDKISFSIANALTEGTWENEFIMKDMEKVAGYLKILQDAGVPVIWRPLHEAAGNYNLYGIRNNAWFWWGKGGAENCKALYRLMRDTFEKTYGLNNLIWVWTLDATQGAESEWADWYPGDNYVDIVGVDIYANDTEAKRRQYQACVDLTEGKKLVTISECGNIPNPQKCINDAEKFNWFLVWSSGTDYYPYNTDSYWKEIMGYSCTLAREDMPNLK